MQASMVHGHYLPGAITGYAESGIASSISKLTPGSLYGVPIQAGGLGNLEIGYPAGRSPAIRWRCKYTGALTSIIFYVAESDTLVAPGAGYSSGTGGTVRVDLQNDDGTANHFPSGTSLSHASAAQVNPGGITFPTLTFNTSVPVVAGNLYHFVFTNTDPNPTSNYVSLDDLYNDVATSPVQPGYSDTDLAILLLDPPGAWVVKPTHTPIFDAAIGANHQGIGYIGARSVAGLFSITSTTPIREQFTLSSSTFTANSASLFLYRVGSPGNLVLTLSGTNGTAVATIPFGSVTTSTGCSWVTGAFGTPLSVVSGNTYTLTASTTSTDGSNYYVIFPMQTGVAYGFGNSTYFSDGGAQAYSGGNWVNYWSTMSAYSFGEHDWMFYLSR